jgi:hypothetical protein
LEPQGFSGWVPLDQMKAEDKVPQTGGVYVVVRVRTEPPEFVAASIGGWFKGNDPTVTSDALVANWVDDAEVVYIGRADQLRRRLRQFAECGAGKPIGHWGGRLIGSWSTAKHCSSPRARHPARFPRDVETSMLSEFRKAWGKTTVGERPALARPVGHA